MGRFSFVSLGLLVVVLSPRGAKGTCPDDWMKIGALCYKVFKEEKNWNDAEWFCKKHRPGCHLASIHTKKLLLELDDYMKDYLHSKENFWIGLHKSKKNSYLEWTDRSKVGYTPWSRTETNEIATDEFCAETDASKNHLELLLDSCYNLHPFLCQCKY